MSSPQGRTKLGQNTDATVAVFRGVFQLRNLISVCEARKILKKTKMYLERHLLPIILSFVKIRSEKRVFPVSSFNRITVFNIYSRLFCKLSWICNSISFRNIVNDNLNKLRNTNGIQLIKQADDGSFNFNSWKAYRDKS